MIVDEGHRMKNHHCKLTQVLNTHYLAPACAAHRNTAAEQAARTVGAAQLPAAHHLQELQHLRAVVQRSVRHDRREGMKTFSRCTSTFRQDTIS